jgi:hypothetical protein
MAIVPPVKSEEVGATSVAGGAVLAPAILPVTLELSKLKSRSPFDNFCRANHACGQPW